MKAVVYRAFGPARDVLRVEDIANPEPGPGEVCVDLAFSAVNPSDVKARGGTRPGVTAPPWPAIIPHSDGAGVISAVGSGVDTARLGERVWIWNGQWQRPFGTAASQITLPSAQAVALPPGTAMEAGAVLGIPGLTASHTVFSGGSVEGRTVLVQGGAGTVGNLAVQLARWGGARVIATCSPRDAAAVEEAGAHAALDYRDPDLADRILSANNGQPVAHIVEVEFGANAETDTAVIAEGGRIAAYGSARAMQPILPFYPLMFKNVTLEMALVYLLSPAQRMAAAARLGDALTAGALSFPPPACFEMTDAAAAHEAVESGQRQGAVLLKTGAV
jgi:NADPH2:quinone reductase